MKQITDFVSSMWRNREGPFENLLRLISYGVMVIPGVGWLGFALVQLASALGWGLGDIGGAVDKYLHLEPGPELRMPQQSNIESAFKEILQQKTASASDEEMIKLAFLGGLFRLTGLIPKIASGLISVMKYIILAAGMTQLGDLYPGNIGSSKDPGVQAPEEDEEGSQDPEKYTQEGGMGLFKMLSDPASGISKMINPFSSLNPLG